MALDTFKTEEIENCKFTAYVWETSEGWASSGHIRIDLKSGVLEVVNIHPPAYYYATKDEAGNAVWDVLLNKIQQ